MTDKNIKKMSKMALRELTDVTSINILICCLFDALNRPITKEQLYEILVENEIVNFFFYNDSMNYLIKSGSIRKNPSKKSSDENTELVLTDRGKQCASELKNFISKSYIDKSIITALAYFAREACKNTLKINYPKRDGKYFVHIKYLDKNEVVFEMKLQTGTADQAKKLGDRVRKNPEEFYNKIMRSFDTSDEFEGVKLAY